MKEGKNLRKKLYFNSFSSKEYGIQDKLFESNVRNYNTCVIITSDPASFTSVLRANVESEKRLDLANTRFPPTRHRVKSRSKEKRHLSIR